MPFLQANIKRDPDGYADEFKLQVKGLVYHLLLLLPVVATYESCCLLVSNVDHCWIPQFRHYKASLEIFNLKPSKESREFAELVHFIAQVGSLST